MGRVRGACWLRAERPAGERASERAREGEGRDCSRAIVLSWWWREGLKGGRHRWWAASVRAACTLYTKMKEGKKEGRKERTTCDVFTYISEMTAPSLFPSRLPSPPIATYISLLALFLQRRTRTRVATAWRPRDAKSSHPFHSFHPATERQRERRHCGRQRRRLQWLRFMLYRIIYKRRRAPRLSPLFPSATLRASPQFLVAIAAAAADDDESFFLSSRRGRERAS